ncbi:MAG: vitamin K epoxide reductase family protein [Bacteroidales bacterium]
MNAWKRNKQIIPLPYSYYFFTVAVILLIGFFDSVYLALSHYKLYTDIGYQSFCAISRAFNCDTVSQSPYSILFGVPVAVWGIFGYAFSLVLLIFAWPKQAERKRIWTLLLIISLCFTLYSLFLAVISTYKIHSYCIMCILSYGVNLLLLYFTWLIRKRFKCEPVFKAFVNDFRYLLIRARVSIPAASFFCVGVLFLLLFFPAYWELTPPALSKKIPTGITENGHPWIGAENPELVIVEFTDYRCFQCKKMHFYLRELIASNPGKIRLVHRHFPMDHTINPIVDQPFHQGAAKLALISIFAEQKGRFWKMNDILFDMSGETKGINIRDLAKRADIPFKELKHIFQDKTLWKKLRKDISAGLEYGLTGTPGFIIEGEAYVGRIPAEILRKYGEF